MVSRVCAGSTCHVLSSFQGARRADVVEEQKGYATMAGTFKLTFKGHSTGSLSYNAADADIEVCEAGSAFGMNGTLWRCGYCF